MKKVFKVLRDMFGSKPSTDTYLVWAKTEYNKDWQFAYQYMLDHDGTAPSTRELNPWNDGTKFKTTNKNLQGWV